MSASNSAYSGAITLSNNVFGPTLQTNKNLQPFGTNSLVTLGDNDATSSGMLRLLNDNSVTFSSTAFGLTPYTLSISENDNLATTINVDNDGSLVTGKTLTVGNAGMGAGARSLAGGWGAGAGGACRAQPSAASAIPSPIASTHHRARPLFLSR